MNEVFYARNVLEYLKNEIISLGESARKGMGTEGDHALKTVAMDLVQCVNRFEGTFNLIDDLLIEADEKLEASLQVIAKNRN